MDQDYLQDPSLDSETKTTPTFTSNTTTNPNSHSTTAANAKEKLKASGASLATSMKSALSSLEPLAQNVSKGLQQVKQLAEEKLGTAEVTPLPHEYLELEAKVDRLKQVHENLVRLASYQLHPGTGTELKLGVNEALNNVAETLGAESNSINNVNEKLRTITVNNQTPNQMMAQEFIRAGQAVGDHTPFGTALMKSAEVQEKIGKSRVKMNNEINEKFVKKMNIQLATAFKTVHNYRRNVHAARVKLDTLKTRARSASPEKAEEMADELQLYQAEFNSLVSVSIDSMKALINSNEALSCLADYMSSMLVYFQSGFELLSELAPELDSMKVVQDSLFDDSTEVTQQQE